MHLQPIVNAKACQRGRRSHETPACACYTRDLSSQSICKASTRCASDYTTTSTHLDRDTSATSHVWQCWQLSLQRNRSAYCALTSILLVILTRKLTAASIPSHMLRRLVALAVFILLPIANTARWDQPQIIEQHTDEITQLPGLRGGLKSRHHGGYITVDDSHKRHLYYYFVTSENKPAKDPLVLWLNGGPGCSSFDGEFAMLCTYVLISVGYTKCVRTVSVAKACVWCAGFIYEHGPFHVKFAKGSEHSQNGSVVLQSNPYSWSKAANIIYLDSPAGTITSISKVVVHHRRLITASSEYCQHYITLHLFVVALHSRRVSCPQVSQHAPDALV